MKDLILLKSTWLEAFCELTGFSEREQKVNKCRKKVLIALN